MEKMNNTPLHTRLEKVALGMWGWVTALDGWMGGAPHSRRYREYQKIHETEAISKTHNLVV